MRILAFHGNAQNKNIFSNIPIVEPFDLPGHGASKLNLPLYSVKKYAIFMEKIISQDSNGPCIVVGHSLSGHIIFQMIKMYPNIEDKIKGIFISGTPPVNMNSLGEAFIPTEAFNCLSKESIHKSEIDILCKYQSKLKIHQEFLKKAFNQQDPKARSVLTHSIEEGLEDEVNILQNLNIPYLLVYGQEECFANLEYIKRLNLNSVIVEDAEHNLMLDKPDIYISLLKKFIEQVD